MNIELDEGIEAFGVEAEELLEEMESALLGLEDTPDDPDQINSVFRAVHTIKGTAGLFAFKDVVEFTHTVESVLDCVRAGELSISADLASNLLSSRDVISGLVNLAVNGDAEIEGDLQSRATDIDSYMKQLLNTAEKCETSSHNSQESEADKFNEPGTTKRWSIRLDLGIDTFRNGQEPLSVINYLDTLGTVESVTCNFDGLPFADSMDPESCYLNLEIDLLSAEDKETIQDAFVFIEDDCEVKIFLALDPEKDAGMMDGVVEEQLSLGKMLLGSGAVTEQEVDSALSEQKNAQEPLGQILISQGAVDSQTVDAAVASQNRTRSASVDGRSARVALERLESLTDLVGELVIAGANSWMLAKKTNDDSLISSMENMGRLIEEIRDTSLGLRMVQISGTFTKFRRVVRDISQKMNKDIHLEINGGDTELDRAVVEKLADPLMHLVRNAMDHGIEMAEEREAKGKKAQGTLKLNAYHDSGHIVIEVEDDGKGLNAEKILNAAQERGIVPQEQALSEQEIFNLIFEPGFSTAEKVTDISGRGVGMDVVRRNIEEVRGHIDVSSVKGKGSKVSIRLPLTLAIIDGFLVRVGNSHYVIPLSLIEVCTNMPPEKQGTGKVKDFIDLGGEVLPCVRLAERFNEYSESSAKENIVVTQFAGHKVGLVVHELLGEYQTVIKPLGRIFKQLSGISGATILGNGSVALIIDVPALIDQITSIRNE